MEAGLAVSSLTGQRAYRSSMISASAARQSRASCKERAGDQPKSGSGKSSLSLKGISNVMRSEEHTPELQSLMRTSYAVFCLKKKKHTQLSSTCYQRQLTTNIEHNRTTP